MLLKSILRGILLALFAACTSNGTIGTAIPRDGSAEYFPLAVDNEWRYATLDNEEEQMDLIVRDSVNEFETTGFSFSTPSSVADRSAAINMLVNGTIHNISSRIIYNGNLPVYIPIFEDTLQIPLKNLVLLKQNNQAFQKVSEIKDSTTSVHTYKDRDIPLYFKYSVESYSDAIPKDFVIDGIPRKNVLTGEITLYLSIEMQPYGKSAVLILPSQPILEIQNHFIENLGIGLIEEHQKFEFKRLSALGLKSDTIIEKSDKQKIISFHFME